MPICLLFDISISAVEAAKEVGPRRTWREDVDEDKNDLHMKTSGANWMDHFHYVFHS